MGKVQEPLRHSIESDSSVVYLSLEELLPTACGVDFILEKIFWIYNETISDNLVFVVAPVLLCRNR